MHVSVLSHHKAYIQLSQIVVLVIGDKKGYVHYFPILKIERTTDMDYEYVPSI